MAMRTEGGWYVVFRGRIPGIYPNCETASAQVDGFPRNLLRRYRSYQEAANAWNDYFQVTASPVLGLSSELPPESEFNRFVHGGRHDTTVTTTSLVPGLGSELPRWYQVHLPAHRLRTYNRPLRRSSTVYPR